MESHELDDPAGAEAQLATLQAQRAALADRVLQPWWHDVATVVFVAGLNGLAWTYRRRTGVWVTPDRKAWFTWVPLALVVLVGAMVLQDRGHAWAMVAAGAVLGVALAALSRRWSRTWVAELRGER